MIIETKVFKSPSSLYLLNLLSICGKRWLWIITSIAFIFIFIGIVLDPIWFVGTLLWLSLIVPFLLISIFIYHGLKPGNVINIVPHSIIFEDSQIIVKVVRKKPDEDAQDKRIFDYGFKKDDTYLYYLKKADFSSIYLRNKHIMLKFGGMSDSLLFLPIDCFENGEGFKKVIQSFSNKNQVRLQEKISASKEPKVTIP